MRIIGVPSKNFWFFICLLLAMGLGVCLRLYGVLDQILLDDEWHGMFFVALYPSSYLLTHFELGATCIPLHLYRWFLLETFGWSEILLRFPLLAASVLSLVIFPVLVRKIFTRRIAVNFAFLLAICPFLITYSRICRPYSMVLLLCFVSVISLYLWTAGQGRKYATFYVVTGILAVYFHFFAAVAVFAPLGYVIAVKITHRIFAVSGRRIHIAPDLRAFVVAAVSVVLLLSVLLVPALILSPIPTMLNVDQITFKSLVGFASMLSGSANGFIVILFFGFFVFGQYRLLRENPLLGGIFLSVFVLYSAVMMLPGSICISSPAVISRYAVVVFPLSFVVVALGMDEVIKYFQFFKFVKSRRYLIILPNVLMPVFWAALFFTGPLLRIYVQPNSFTNHPAFYESYQLLNWEQPYNTNMERDLLMKKEDVPAFYRWLSEQPGKFAIIEYPMDICGDFNLYYYYQHFHKKRVMVGYITEPDIQGYGVPEGKSVSSVTPGRYIDKVLSSVSDKSRLKFRNMVDMMNVNAVRKSGAGYIILHKYLFAEMFPSFFNEQMYMPVAYLDQLYREVFGMPVFEDRNIVVFSVSGGGGLKR